MFRNAQKINWIGLIGLHVLAVLLMCSWLWPVLRPYWDRMDRAVFFFLNGTMAYGEGMALLWAVVNFRTFDLVALLILAIPFLAPETVFSRESINLRFFQFVVLVKVTGLCRRFLVGIMDYERLSPTLVLEPAYRISKLVPYIRAKDESTESFPGDHAAILGVGFNFGHLSYCQGTRCPRTLT